MEAAPRNPSRAAVLVLGFGFLAWSIATVHFLWLGMHFVPEHAGLLGGFGKRVPFYARLVSVIANDFVRWLPFGVLLAPFVGLLLFPIARRLTRLTWWAPATIVRALTVIALLGSTVTVAASFATIHSVHDVYLRLALENAPRP